MLNFPKHTNFFPFWWISEELWPLFLRSHFFLVHPVFTIFTLLCCNIVCSFSSFWLMVSYLICILEICQNYEYKIKNKWKQVPKVHMFSFLPNIMKYYHDQSLSTFWLKKLKVPHPEIILWMLNSTIIWSYFRMRRIKLWSPTSGCGW